MSEEQELFTCVTCSVAFLDPNIQRAHYKTEWHRYNLKRKVADLPPIGAKDFAAKVKQNKADSAKPRGTGETFCKLCSKHFQTLNSFSNHKQSKKHKELESAFIAENIADEAEEKIQDEPLPETVLPDELISTKSDRTAKKIAQLEEMLKKQDEEDARRKKSEEDSTISIEEIVMEDETQDEEGGKDWEDVDEQAMDEIDETKGIDVRDCFFCDFKSKSVEGKCEHMAKEHCFHIPDMDHVCDLEGLVKFLGVKLGAYNVCLWCSSKCYRDLLAVQRHMEDKGHQKCRFEGETLAEYADFYSFDEDQSVQSLDDISDFEMVEVADHNNTTKLCVFKTGESAENDFELELPSGSKIGHRSLFKYYKQRFGHRSLEMKARSGQTIKGKYMAIAGNHEYSSSEMVKSRKDLAYFQRWRAHMGVQIARKNNKISRKHFRRQDLIF